MQNSRTKQINQLNTINMNKQEAIAAMQSGKKVTHRYFTPDEWMTIKNGFIYLEDNVQCPIAEFFKYRASNDWEDGYSVLDETVPTPQGDKEQCPYCQLDVNNLPLHIETCNQNIENDTHKNLIAPKEERERVANFCFGGTRQPGVTKFIITAEMRDLEQRVTDGDISYSKMIEILCQMADEYAGKTKAQGDKTAEDVAISNLTDELKTDYIEACSDNRRLRKMLAEVTGLSRIATVEEYASHVKGQAGESIPSVKMSVDCMICGQSFKTFKEYGSHHNSAHPSVPVKEDDLSSIPAAKEVAGEDVLTPGDIKEGLRESFFKSTGLQYADRLINYATFLEEKIVEYRQSHPVNTGDGWIKVEDGLPEIESTVLSLGDDGIRQTIYTTYHKGSTGFIEGRLDKWFEYTTHNNYCMHHNHVTHWQPLPLPPCTITMLKK